MKGIPQSGESIAGLALVGYSFDGRQSFFPDPVHEVPGARVRRGDFVNLLVKEGALGFLYGGFVGFPLLKAAMKTIGLKAFGTVLVPPFFGMFGDLLCS